MHTSFHVPRHSNEFNTLRRFRPLFPINNQSTRQDSLQHAMHQEGLLSSKVYEKWSTKPDSVFSELYHICDNDIKCDIRVTMTPTGQQRTTADVNWAQLSVIAYKWRYMQQGKVGCVELNLPGCQTQTFTTPALMLGGKSSSLVPHSFSVSPTTSSSVMPSVKNSWPLPNSQYRHLQYVQILRQIQIPQTRSKFTAHPHHTALK